MNSRKRMWASLLVITLAVVFCLGAKSVKAGEGTPDRIFILHSYEKNHVCGQPQHDGVVAALKKSQLYQHDNIEIETYYMDTKRKNNTPELIQQQADKALKAITAFRPTILITLDDNAFRTVALELVGAPFPIVFSGLNGQPEDYNKKRPFMVSRERPNANITGVYEKLHIVDAIRVHTRLFPEIKKIRIFVDGSPTGKAITKQIKLEMRQEVIPCQWDMKVINSWEEYQREIHKTNRNNDIGAIYPAVLLLKAQNGKTFTAPDIFAWTVENSKKPEIPLNYAFTRMGLFGGAAVDFYAMGHQVGTMAAKLLTGATPAEIPIEDAQRFALVFNLKRAKQLGITLPSEILLAADEVITDSL